MPYSEEWIENEERFRFYEIPIFAAYKDDGASHMLQHWFNIDPQADETQSFDARDLPKLSHASFDLDKRLSIQDGVRVGGLKFESDDEGDDFYKIAYALWDFRLIPIFYTEAFVLAQIWELVCETPRPKFDLNVAVQELLLRCNWDSEEGKCLPMESPGFVEKE